MQFPFSFGLWNLTYLAFFRVASDLEPIQPLLAKHMQCLEFDLFEENKSFMEEATRNKDAISAVMNSRPRARFTKESLWIGLKTLYATILPLIHNLIGGFLTLFHGFKSVIYL